ncbi:hypothetical protein F7725_027407 [Dissostichus mawsoni]|uniref:SHC (Src homology 2 domain containing) transforming protein 2 n=1 Tax=Dissostichus mawsoni TaxID=36200 RepID=A0A7J5XDR2_DISMA|nr:hypothetical protein F7725_027407 [Dissostichus mawsoni]
MALWGVGKRIQADGTGWMFSDDLSLLLLQASPPGMLLKPKYGRFRNESVTSSSGDLMHSLAMSGKVVATPVVSVSATSLPLPPLPPLPHLPPLDHSARASSSSGATALADSPCLDGEQEATTTFCMLIPRMPQWKFSNSLLSRSPSNSSSSSSSSKDSVKVAPSTASQSSSPHRRSVVASASGPVASLAAVLNSCDPVCDPGAEGGGSCTLGQSRGHGFGAMEAMASPGGSSNSRSGMSRRTRVEGMWLGGEDFPQKGNFIHKPTQGWLHADNTIAGPGASYIVRYMGCIEVLKSMRALDFNTRTQVTREAINRLCDTVPGGKGAWRKKTTNKALQTVMGKSNLRFAGMSIAVNICIDGLGLLIPTTRQVIAHHPMQSISFASGGDTDTPDYVAYVAKDPVNQRACHILECSDGLAESVISTIGQAFELQFKHYLHSPPKTMMSMESIPGKEPPVGGVVDSRLRPSGSLLGHIHTQPQSKTAAQSPRGPNEEQLRRETWYHSRLSRRDAEKLLVRDGDFLVRESTTNQGQYVLTGMHCGLPKHLLLVDPEGVSISHLIAYHLKNELPIVAAESELHLKQVVRRKLCFQRSPCKNNTEMNGMNKPRMDIHLEQRMSLIS